MFCHVTLPQVSEFIWHWRCSTAPGFGSIPINLTNDQMFYGDTQGSDSPFVLQLPAALGHTHTYINIAFPPPPTHTYCTSSTLPSDAASAASAAALMKNGWCEKKGRVKQAASELNRFMRNRTVWSAKCVFAPSRTHTHTPIIKECLRPRSGISFLFQHKVLTVVHLLRYFFTQWGYD